MICNAWHAVRLKQTSRPAWAKNETVGADVSMNDFAL